MKLRLVGQFPEVKVESEPYATLISQANNLNQGLSNPKLEKYGLFYELARGVSRGRIVELGAGFGYGTVALSLGARDGNKKGIHVDTVDWFQDCEGRSGALYLKEDFQYFQKNTEWIKGNPILHITTFSHAAEDWAFPISILVWDGDVYRISDDLDLWERFVLPGGKIVLVDTYEEYFVGRDKVRSLETSGYYEDFIFYQNNEFSISVIEKK